MDPFAAALDAMFVAPGSAAAVYQPQHGTPKTIRVIRTSPEDGRGNTVLTNTGIEVRYSDVADPRPGDFVAIGGEIVGGLMQGGEAFRLFGDAQSDLERLSWSCGLEPYR